MSEVIGTLIVVWVFWRLMEWCLEEDRASASPAEPREPEVTSPRYPFRKPPPPASRGSLPVE